MHNTAQHNRHQHNAGAAAAAAAATAHPQQTYRLEVREADGDLVAGLDGYWYDAEWEAETNAAGKLTLSMDYSSTLWGYMSFPRQIWLRSGNGTILEKFHIIAPERSYENIAVECSSLIDQLAREYITNFEAGNETQACAQSGTGGTFTLRWRGQTTSTIAYNASAATIQSALEALSNIDVGDVTVTGTAASFSVEFAGNYAQKNVPKLRMNCASITGDTRGTVTVTRAVKTISQIVASWLNNDQTNTRPIHFGSVDPGIGALTRAIKVENKSILEAILELHGTAGGYFYVDPSTRRFYWKRVTGANTGQYIRMGDACSGVRESVDYSGIVTRVICYGVGETLESALTTTINDATAQSAYGIIPAILINKSIVDSADLTAYGQAYLDARKVPVKKYEVGVIDIAKLASADYSFFDLSIGSRIKVIDATLGLTLNTVIARITRSLDNPLDMQISVGNPDSGTSTWAGGAEAGSPGNTLARERDITDSIADLFKDIYNDLAQDGGFAEALADTLPGVLDDLDSGEPGYESIREIMNEAGAFPGYYESPGERVTHAAGTAGSGTLVAHGNHTHQEPPDMQHNWSRPDYATATALLTVNGEMGYDQARHIPLLSVNTGWAVPAVIVATNWVDLPTTNMPTGTIAYVTSTKQRYVFNATAWVIFGFFCMTTTPTAATHGLVRDDLWMDTTEHRLKHYDGSTWLIIPMISPSANVTQKMGDIDATTATKISIYTDAAAAKRLVTHVS